MPIGGAFIQPIPLKLYSMFHVRVAAVPSAKTPSYDHPIGTVTLVPVNTVAPS